MEEPSSSPSEAEHLESDHAPHDQEVARRRAAVRAAAEQEAADILRGAQREIRHVLVRTRQELVTLTAQVRAAGCDPAPDQSDQSSAGDDFRLFAAREVRTVLRDARAGLSQLSSDAANRWPGGEEARLLASAVTMEPPPPPANHFWSPLTQQETGGASDDATEEARPGLAGKLRAHWRTAAVAIVILAVVLTAIVARRRFSAEADLVKVRTAETVTTSPLGPARSAPAPRPEATTSAAAATAPNASGAATTNGAGVRPTPARPSAAGPLEPAATSGVRAGTAPDAPPSTALGLRTPAQVSTPQKMERAATAAESAASAEREILERHQRWFEAFERGDRRAMAALASENFSLIDQRPERAQGSGRIQRRIHDVRVQVTEGVGAVLSGRIDETTADAATTLTMLSEVWIRRGEEWRLVSVRLVPLSAVPTTLQ